MKLNQTMAKFLVEFLHIDIDDGMIADDEPVNYPDNPGGALLAHIDACGETVRARVRTFCDTVDDLADDFAHAGPPHDRRPPELTTEAGLIGEATLSSLSKWRSSTEATTKEIAKVTNPRRMEGYENAIDNLRVEVDKDMVAFAERMALHDVKRDQTIAAAGPALEIYSAEQRAAQNAYFDLYGEVQAQMTQLVDWATANSATLDRDLSANVGSITGDYVAALPALQQIQTRATAEKVAHEQLFERAKEALLQRIATVDGQIKALRKAKIPSAMTDSLQSERDKAQLIADTGKSIRALDGAKAFLDQAETMIGKLQGDDVAATMTAITDAQAAIKTVLDKSEYQTLRPADYAETKAASDTLDKVWTSKEPEAARVSYDMLKAKIVEDGSHAFKGRCEEQKSWASDLHTRVSEFETLVGRLDSHVKALGLAAEKKYQGALKAELATFKDISSGQKTPSDMARIRTALAVQIERAQKFLAVTREDVSAANADAFELSQDQTQGKAAADEFKVGLDTFKEAHAALAKSVSDAKKHPGAVARPDEYKAIKTQLDAAMNSAEKTKDLETANSLLTRTKKRFETLKDPESSIDRNALGDIQTRWERAVHDFEAKTDELIRNVQDGTTATAYVGSEIDLERAITELRKVVNLQDVNLTAPASTLQDNSPDNAAARKRARETVLAEMRRIRDFVVQNPAFKHVVANPFDTPGIATKLNTALRDIELDVLRGV